MKAQVYGGHAGRPETISDEHLQHLADRIRAEQNRRTEAEAWNITQTAIRRWQWAARPRLAS
jgi:hypothetical protein